MPQPRAPKNDSDPFSSDPFSLPFSAYQTSTSYHSVR